MNITMPIEIVKNSPRLNTAIFVAAIILIVFLFFVIRYSQRGGR